jgi:predicted nucleotidyltransferase
VGTTSAEVEAYLEQVVSTLRDHLGSELVGVYLHGSVAMGGFTAGRSDVDVLGVCAGPVSPERGRALGEALAAIPRIAAGTGLEFSLVTEASARSASAAPAFEVHVSHEEPFVTDGHDHPGDDDLPLHFAVLLARGRSLFGPGPSEVFAEPDRKLLVRSMLADIEMARSEGVAWWDDHDVPEAASMTYQVLNGARCLRYLETGELGSKVEGGEWLKGNDADPDVHALVDAALAYQRGDAPEHADERVVEAFMDRVETSLRAADTSPRSRPASA